MGNIRRDDHQRDCRSIKLIVPGQDCSVSLKDYEKFVLCWMMMARSGLPGFVAQQFSPELSTFEQLLAHTFVPPKLHQFLQSNHLG